MSVSFSYASQNVLVTGSTKGIGLVIAREYAKAGANVFIHGRSQSDIDSIAAKLKSELGLDAPSTSQRICGKAADLSKSEDIQALVEFIDSKAEHLDVLVNNAGIFNVRDFFDSSDDDWQRMFEVNVMSGVRLTRIFLKRMLEPMTTKMSDSAVVVTSDAGGSEEDAKSSASAAAEAAAEADSASASAKKGGNVVFISSECGARGLVQMSHYAASKACQMNITRSLAQLTKGIPNVRVNCLLPGPTWTEGVAKYMADIAERTSATLEDAVANYFKTHEPSSIKQQFLQPKEIADACLFLTSDGASSMDGACVRCEGGLINTM